MSGRSSRILFVQGDPEATLALEKAVAKRGLGWESRFVVSVRKALSALAAEPAHFVFTDIDLPDGDGVDLLRQVEAQFPDTVRIIVADPREMGSLRSSGIAQRYLTRPWDIDAIIEVVRRRYELEASLADRGLEELLARTDRLPAAPSAYTQITAEMRSREPSIGRVAAIIAQDPALTAKVLQHVNSAFFALRHEVTTVEKAVAMLGMNPIMAIVMSIGLYGQSGGAPVGLVETIKQNAMAVAALTRVVAKIEGSDPGERDAALIAGMLHDCGKLVMATNWPQLYGDIAEADDLALETQVIGANHSLIGAYLLAQWNLSDAIVEAVAHHHKPSTGNFDDFGAPAIVHVAHALTRRPGDGTLPGLDTEFIGKLDLWDQIEAWIAAADEFEFEVANR